MKFLSVLFSLLLSVSFIACKTDRKSLSTEDLPEKPIVVVFENDVHGTIDGYAKFAGLRNQQLTVTPYVTSVSCGDFVQGDVVASFSKGENIIEIMNKVKYDIVALGNHEFDYGMSQLKHLTETLDASVVCANFHNLHTGKRVYPAYQIISYGNVDIAYIGFTTSITMTSTSPKTFQDEKGNFIYDFMKDSFYQNAQSCVDEARSKGADYVVVLSHLGNFDKGEHANSISLITQTSGIDVVLDGHEHLVISDSLVVNKKGEPVLLASAGTNFSNIGLLTLSTKGKFSSRLVSTESDEIPVDKEVANLVDNIKEKVLEDGNHVIGISEVALPFKDSIGYQIVRKQETALGNLCADAFRIMLDTDIAMLNGGGIRSDLPKGEVTFNDLLSVFPFNNTACIATLTGQQLMDVLEFSVSLLPYEDGSFMQVSGLKFNVDSSIPSAVVMDEKDLFLHVKEGKRRVSNLQIWDKVNKTYQPVDLERRYSLASFSYQLKELGSSGIFRYTELKEDNLGQDVEVLASYIDQILGGKINNQNADVEGRIVIQ